MSAEEIARGLTKAQRRVVLTDDSRFVEDWKGHWHSRSCATAAVLHRKGLIEKPFTLSRATPLGLEVRAHLENEHGPN